jgi:hypothetical protein
MTLPGGTVVRRAVAGDEATLRDVRLQALPVRLKVEWVSDGLQMVR